MPTSAYDLLILGLFVIAWIAIAWRFHLPADGKGRGPTTESGSRTSYEGG
jgi:hypothetical protein